MSGLPPLVAGLRFHRVAPLRLVGQSGDRFHQTARDVHGIVDRRVRDRRAERDGDRDATFEVLRAALGQDPLAPPHGPRDERRAGRHGHARGARLAGARDEGPADRALREHADHLAGLEGDDGRVDGIRGEPKAVHGKVLHATHQRSGEPVIEDLLLGHEAHQALARPGPVPDEHEIEVANVVRSDHRGPVGRDVVCSRGPDVPRHRLEQGQRHPDDRPVDVFHKQVTLCPHPMVSTPGRTR